MKKHNIKPKQTESVPFGTIILYTISACSTTYLLLRFYIPDS